MRFTETRIAGTYIIDIEPVTDERGFFARSWCRREFQSRQLKDDFVQCSISFNRLRSTLRGMHFQVAPHAETKIVRCTTGAICDVVLDLRQESPTFRQWTAVELSGQNRRMMYIPEGCAHGFQTLVDETEVFYQMTPFHAPEAARGVRWNDPAFQIAWPLPNPIVSTRDRSYPDFVP